MPAPQIDYELLNARQVCAFVGLSRTTLYELLGKGAFPKPVRITPHTPRWRSDVLARWIEERQEGMRPAA